MKIEELKKYLDNLNLSYYTESELQKIYNAVSSVIKEIEENIGREQE